jgi:iron complex outermembrane receptor protein
LLLALSVPRLARVTYADEAPAADPQVSSLEYFGGFGFVEGQLVDFLQLPQNPSELDPGSQQFEPFQGGSMGGGFGRPREAGEEAGGNLNDVSQLNRPKRGADEVANRKDFALRPAPSPGAVLQDDPNIQTVNVQRRSNVDFDPRIRGYRDGQILTYGSGAYITAVRPDLDSMLGRIDPHLVAGIDVFSGPYTSRLGPGFSFLNVRQVLTPRDQCTESRLGYTFRGNGSQHFAVAGVSGGDADSGYITNYTYRNGVDYRAGDGSRQPGNYLLNNVTTQYGINLAADTRLEMRYDYQNQANTRIPGQFFSIDLAETHAVAMSLIDTNNSAPWTKMQFDMWFNDSGMRGTLVNDSYFHVRDRVDSALTNLFNTPTTLTGNTGARLESAGARSEYLFGEADDANLIVGADVRHLHHRIIENYQLATTAPVAGVFSQQLPTSEMFNTGVYSELVTPLASWWTTRFGGRADYVHTTAFITDPANSNIDPAFRKQDNTPYSFFATSDMDLTQRWKSIVKVGQAQRVPTLLERYSSGLVLARLQSGLTRVIGDDTLGPERLWQVDASLIGNYDDLQLRLTAFNAWIHNYITYTGNNVTDLTGANLVRQTATPQALLYGYEARADQVLSGSWSTFAASHLVIGEDQTIHQPLPGMSPLEGQIGLRWQDWENPDRLGVETIVRIVDSQQRVARIRQGVFFNPNGVTQVEQVTPAFTTVNIRAYYNPTRYMRWVAGIENLFDATYLQHLDIRLQQQGPFNSAFAYAPGFTPYIGLDWTF